jgi:5-hydroxyisourate hydrolase-like protein (transthyretin family)
MKHTQQSLFISILSALVLLLSACGAGGSQAPISGKIQIDAPGGKYPAAGLEVHLSDPALLEAEDPNARLATVYTDEEGRYAFPDVKPGSYSLGAYTTDLAQVTSEMTGEECTIQTMTFNGEWFTMLGSTNDGKNFLMAALNETIELKEGDRLTFDLALDCK